MREGWGHIFCLENGADGSLGPRPRAVVTSAQADTALLSRREGRVGGSLSLLDNFCMVHHFPGAAATDHHHHGGLKPQKPFGRPEVQNESSSPNTEELVSWFLPEALGANLFHSYPGFWLLLAIFGVP